MTQSEIAGRYMPQYKPAAAAETSQPSLMDALQAVPGVTGGR
jgi:hypothetical protein